jgi:hypothetical protein
MQTVAMHDNPSHARPGLSKRFFVWSEVLLVCAAVTFSGALLGRDYATVQSRKAVLNQYAADSQFRCVRKSDPAYPLSDRTPDVSWFRRMLGDNAIAMILLPPKTTSDVELARVRAIFPEARVERLPIRK